MLDIWKLSELSALYSCVQNSFHLLRISSELVKALPLVSLIAVVGGGGGDTSSDTLLSVWKTSRVRCGILVVFSSIVDQR